MTSDELIANARGLIEHLKTVRDGNAAQAMVCEFFRQYAGPRSSFLESASGFDPRMFGPDYWKRRLPQTLEAFIAYVKRGLLEAIPPERRAQLDVVSDILDQAQALLDDAKVHPAAAAVLIGATLEEFLRTWTESADLKLGGKKPSLDSYAKVLREDDLITKQDVKDITAWAGIRNSASHGDWDNVSDRSRVKIMLEGVNLFMRKYS